MTIERYTAVPAVMEYLVIDETTTIADIAAWVWVFVDIEATFAAMSVGNRLGQAGDIYIGTPPGTQLITATNPEYTIGEKA